MSFFENTRKPVGLGGKIMVAMMNLWRKPMIMKREFLKHIIL